MADFCHGHWVTSSLGVWSHSHQHFISVVTWSVTALSTSIGVTTP